jgi:hypothetical protein
MLLNDRSRDRSNLFNVIGHGTGVEWDCIDGRLVAVSENDRG